MRTQLLDLFIHEYTFDNFIPLSNIDIIKTLKNDMHQFLHLNGSKYTGKTHLLQAWCNWYKNYSATILYLPAENLQSNLIDDVGKYHYIAIDNIEKLNEQQQVILFNLFNIIKLNNLQTKLLTSSNIPLNKVPYLRNDLTTRLQSGITLSLKALTDNDLITALTIFADSDGISLGTSEKEYLINHYPRNIGLLINLLRNIDKEALIQKRNITVLFIKTLNLLESHI
jgi:DnaA family protein